MPLQSHDRANFQTLQRAALNKDICLMECTEKATGKPAALICMVNRDNGDYVMVPVARMIEGDPYEQFTPPA